MLHPGIHGPHGRLISAAQLEHRHAPSALCEAVQHMITDLQLLQRECGMSREESYSSLNFAVTDGHTVVATWAGVLFTCTENPATFNMTL